ncbi:putative transposase [Cucumis melo var. makuwa]|uniref:Transposase n=1 Tax=Cucumis melo var. makuwa TaxID=1194695 RepID=A0A5A7TJG7_CUCMM|nr:putative transposase [Cucumis melo var. makuwa]TYK19691.1 putative transposase [Cucumis melo var. makuwa]
MVITAHFIDDDWNLHKRILNFCQVANHKGDTIGRAIEKCLEGWGIDRLFTITVDNASSNDVAIAYLVKKFKGRNGNAVKYVRSSPARLQIFKDFAKEDKMSTKNYLTMDVPTRWNSTFTMLDGAIKCQKTFERLEEHDPSYLPKDDIPTTEDWDNTKVFVKFLKTFSEVARYLDEARIDCMGDEYLDLLTWWKVNSSRFKIISQVAKDIYSIPRSTMPSESAFSTGGRNWIQSKPLDDMTEEIDGAEEIDEESINIGKEMEAAFENLNNDSMHCDGSTSLRTTEPDPSGMFSQMAIQFKRLLIYPTVYPIQHYFWISAPQLFGSYNNINTLMRCGSVCGGKIESGG